MLHYSYQRKPVSVEVQDRRRPPTGPALPRTTPHRPPTLSTSLGRTSPIEWSATSSSEELEDLVVCRMRGRRSPFYSVGGPFPQYAHIESIKVE